jgi:hypothetical protein
MSAEAIQDRLTQWPYQWELVNEQGQRIHLIAQDILISAEQYPESVHRTIKTAKVVVLDLPKQFNKEFSLCAIYNAFLHRSKEAIVALSKYDVDHFKHKINEAFKNHPQKVQEKELLLNIIGKLFKINIMADQWFKKLNPTQQEKAQRLLNNFNSRFLLKNTNLLTFMQFISNDIEDNYHLHAKDSLLNWALQEKDLDKRLLNNKGSLTLFSRRMLGEVRIACTITNTLKRVNELPIIQIGNDQMDVEDLSIEVLKGLKNHLSYTFSRISDMIDEIKEELDKDWVNALLDPSSVKKPSGFHDSYYFQTAQKTNHVAMQTFIDEETRSKANKLKNTVSETLAKHNEVTVIANMNDAGSLLEHLQAQGFVEAKA